MVYTRVVALCLPRTATCFKVNGRIRDLHCLDAEVHSHVAVYQSMLVPVIFSICFELCAAQLSVLSVECEVFTDQESVPDLNAGMFFFSPLSLGILEHACSFNLLPFHHISSWSHVKSQYLSPLGQSAERPHDQPPNSRHS